METKPLIYGIIGFLLGGFIVSLVAVTVESDSDHMMEGNHGSMSMEDMNTELAQLEGSEFDEAYLSMMIAHHEGALDMAGLAETRADRQEIKDLSDEIMAAQKTEIELMKQWQEDWGFDVTANESNKGGHGGH